MIQYMNGVGLNLVTIGDGLVAEFYSTMEYL